MKNKAVVLLILIAIPLYLWDSHLLLTGLFNIKKPALSAKSTIVHSVSSPVVVPAVRFVEKGRSPFIPYKENVVSVKNEVKKKKDLSRQTSTNPPKVTVTGIMWNPANPIAMLTLPDGPSNAVKSGQTIGNIIVKTVEKNRVLIVYEKKEFWISR